MPAGNKRSSIRRRRYRPKPTFGQFWVVTYAALMLQAEQANLPRSFVLSAFVFLVAVVCIQLLVRGPQGAFVWSGGDLGIARGHAWHVDSMAWIQRSSGFG